MPVRDAEGTVIGVLGVYNDITQRRRASDAREALIDELVMQPDIALAAAAAKSSFVGNMSGELRAPLGAIIAYAEALRGAGAGVVRDRDLDTILHAAHSLLGMVNDLLDMSQFAAEGISANQ